MVNVLHHKEAFLPPCTVFQPLAVKKYLAVAFLDKSAQASAEGTFSCAVFADYADYLAVSGVQVKPGENLLLAVAEAKSPDFQSFRDILLTVIYPWDKRCFSQRPQSH